MFLTAEKFQRRVKELGTRRYFDLQNLSPFTAMEGQLGPDDVYHGAPPVIQGQTISTGMDFIGRDRYLWMEKKLRLPDAREGCDVVGLFDFGRTGGGNNSGFEAMLYVNGHPWQGVDSNHSEVILTPYAGQEVTLTFLLWTGLEGGGQKQTLFHRIARADIGYLDCGTDRLYYLAEAITELLPCLPEESTDRTVLTQALDRALLLIDWDAEYFLPSVHNALQSLQQELEKYPKDSPVTVNVVGHTHIDVAWLWRLKHTREKAQRSFSTVLRLMDKYDEYIFLQTQPQLYKYLKSDCPELYEQIKERVREGRWESDGGMWLEADCNIPSGESLARQFQHGITFFKEEMGTACEFLWLPDVFGYSWALPQIMKLCGLKTFMTTKINWNKYNTMPNDLFLWRGIDGTEIMTYFIETPNPGQPLNERNSTYNGQITPYTVTGTWKRFKNKELTNDILIAYGFGDGGGGVNRDMLERRRALDALPGAPNVKTEKAGDFFRKIHSEIEHTDQYVPVWDGELYLEYHRGTYTSQARNKRANRKLEFMLCETEWLASMASQNGAEYPAVPLYTAWETLLRNQFHDIIPGSSIHEVYEDSQKEYASVLQSLQAERDKLFSALCQSAENVWSAFQFGSFDRRELIAVPESRPGTFTDQTGAILPSQRDKNGNWMVLQEIPALSSAEIHFIPGNDTSAENPFRPEPDGHTLTTPYYRITWSEKGTILSLYDLENHREVLKGQGNILRVYEDKPLDYDAWDIDIYYTQKHEDIDACRVEWEETGPVRAVLKSRYHYRASTIEQRCIFYAHSRRIDFETRVDWHEDHRLLKVLFETDIRSTKAAYDIQYGHLERPTHWNTSWDWARFESCGHKWADLSEHDYGVSLLNDCKYGYGIHDGVISLSLLKSAKRPDTEADMGAHQFTYSLYPHSRSVTDGGTIEESVILNLPAIVRPGKAVSAGKRLIYADSDQVAIDAVKRAEDGDGYVVRLHECRGGSAEVCLKSDYSLKQAADCNLLEEYAERVSETQISFRVKPFEIKTYRLWF